LDPAVVSLAVNEDDVWMLHTDGLLTLIREMKAKAFRLETEAAFGVVPLKGGEVLAIDGSGCLSRLRLDEQMTLVAKIPAGIPIRAYALNPFRTMLAYLSPEHRQVRGMFIETQKENEFLADMDLSPALAFNPGGRELAIGTPSGGVAVLDVATRKIAYRLEPSWLITGSPTPCPITFLRAYSELEWLVLYEDNRMMKWSTEGEALGSTMLPSTPTCVEIGPNGEIAVGSRSGYVRVYDAEFEETFKDKIQRTKVIQLAFAENGRSLYSIGNDDELRRTRL
jgi:hypothetical protein